MEPQHKNFISSFEPQNLPAVLQSVAATPNYTNHQVESLYNTTTEFQTQSHLLQLDTQRLIKRKQTAITHQQTQQSALMEQVHQQPVIQTYFNDRSVTGDQWQQSMGYLHRLAMPATSSYELARPSGRENTPSHKPDRIQKDFLANNLKDARSIKGFKRPYSVNEQLFYKQELAKRYCSQLAGKITSQPAPFLEPTSSLNGSQVPQLISKTTKGPQHTAHQNNISNLPSQKPESISIKQPQIIQHEAGQSSKPTKQSVCDLMDLPQNKLHYVTLEDFRCPCFMMAGEPYLATPPLLNFLKRRFSLLRIVKTIDEFNINFYLASDQQMDTLRSFVLASSSRCCPLIKHSDADRVALDLHEQCYKKKAPRDPNLYKKQLSPPMLSKDSINQDQQQDQHSQPSTATFYSTKCNIVLNQNIPQNPSISSSSIAYKSHHQHNIPPAHEATNPKKPFTAILESSMSTFVTDSVHLTNLMKQDVPYQAQNLTHELARTTTLLVTIRVYHRCFGKCTGLYYPQLLKRSQYDCIECVACGRMFAPKRFIGHVHWPKEKNVVNWGFNSYNWPQYIRLCKRQATNNLSDPELLEQFQKLQRIKNSDQSLSDDCSEYEFDKIDDAEQLRELTECQQDEYYDSKARKASSNESFGGSGKRNDDLANYRPSRELVEAIISASTCSLLDNYSGIIPTTTHTSSSSPLIGTNYYKDPLPAIQPLLANSSNTTVITSYNHKDILPAVSSIDNYKSRASNEPLNIDTVTAAIYNHGSLSLMSALNSNYNNFNEVPRHYASHLPPTVPHHELGDSATQWHCQQQPLLGLTRQQQYINNQLELKREIYISSYMNTYLRVTGISPTLANDILEHTLDIVRKSKFIT